MGTLLHSVAQLRREVSSLHVVVCIRKGDGICTSIRMYMI